VRFAPKDFRQRRPEGKGWIWNLDGVRRVLYRLPKVIEAIALERPIAITEGEKDADRLCALGVTATTNPGGADKGKGSRKWRPEYTEMLRGADVILVGDNDDVGRAFMCKIAAALRGAARRVRVIDLPTVWPQCPPKADVSDWLDVGHGAQEFRALIDAAPDADCEVSRGTDADTDSVGVSLTDFHAYMPAHSYIYRPTREMWPASSVSAKIAPVAETDEHSNPVLDAKGNPKYVSASAWLDINRSVEQMTWAPGEPELIGDRYLCEGGFIERKGAMTFNLYRPPTLVHGDASKAGPWLNHVRRVYGDHADHIIKFAAHRVQRPQEKINHALMLGGAQGIGKDTILQPLKYAVGPWNFIEVSPTQVLGRFNSFIKSVVLRISEARDLGEVDRFKFYDHMKSLTAAPPDVLRVDEKHLPPKHPVRELWVSAGRRTAKTTVAAGVSCYLAAFSRPKVISGETPTVLLIAASQDQAREAFNRQFALSSRRPIAQQVPRSFWRF
jgi:hypothetical protein